MAKGASVGHEVIKIVSHDALTAPRDACALDSDDANPSERDASEHARPRRRARALAPARARRGERFRVERALAKFNGCRVNVDAASRARDGSGDERDG